MEGNSKNFDPICGLGQILILKPVWVIFSSSCEYLLLFIITVAFLITLYTRTSLQFSSQFYVDMTTRYANICRSQSAVIFGVYCASYAFKCAAIRWAISSYITLWPLVQQILYWYMHLSSDSSSSFNHYLVVLWLLLHSKWKCSV